MAGDVGERVLRTDVRAPIMYVRVGEVGDWRVCQ